MTMAMVVYNIIHRQHTNVNRLGECMGDVNRLDVNRLDVNRLDVNRRRRITDLPPC